MNVNEATAIATAEAPRGLRDRLAALRGRFLTRSESLLTARYLLVSGVFGVPASIVQLAAIGWLYTYYFGDFNHLELNAMAIVNFEISLMRNYIGHCAFTWRMRPTWRRARHAHVAAIGAFVISLTVFNIVEYTIDIIPLAQLAGAASGFALNFSYNKFKTFVAEGVIEEGGRPSESSSPVPADL